MILVQLMLRPCCCLHVLMLTVGVGATNTVQEGQGVLMAHGKALRVGDLKVLIIRDNL